VNRTESSIDLPTLLLLPEAFACDGVVLLELLDELELCGGCAGSIGTSVSMGGAGLS
jgi:hypothetical protein